MPFQAEHLTDRDFKEGDESYIRYCTGIAILQYPVHFNDLHGCRDLEDEAETQEVILCAEKLMIEGTRRIIHIAHPPELRIDFKSYEQDFEIALAGMYEIVDHACSFGAEDRLTRLNDHFTTLRPAAFTRQGVYRNICHGNYGKLNTIDLMDGYLPAVNLSLPLQRHNLSISPEVSE